MSGAFRQTDYNWEKKQERSIKKKKFDKEDDVVAMFHCYGNNVIDTTLITLIWIELGSWTALRRQSARSKTWSAAGKGNGIKMKGGTLSAILLQTKVEENKKKKKANVV